MNRELAKWAIDTAAIFVIGLTMLNVGYGPTTWQYWAVSLTAAAWHCYGHACGVLRGLE